MSQQQQTIIQQWLQGQQQQQAQEHHIHIHIHLQTNSLQQQQHNPNQSVMFHQQQQTQQQQTQQQQIHAQDQPQHVVAAAKSGTVRAKKPHGTTLNARMPAPRGGIRGGLTQVVAGKTLKTPRSRRSTSACGLPRRLAARGRGGANAAAGRDTTIGTVNPANTQQGQQQLMKTSAPQGKVTSPSLIQLGQQEDQVFRSQMPIRSTLPTSTGASKIQLSSAGLSIISTVPVACIAAQKVATAIQQQPQLKLTPQVPVSSVRRTSHNNYEIQTRYVLQNRSGQQMAGRDRYSTKMLVIISTGEQRLLTFELPRESCIVQKMLEQIGVPFDKNTNIRCIENPGANIEFVVTVGFAVQESTSRIIASAERILSEK